MIRKSEMLVLFILNPLLSFCLLEFKLNHLQSKESNQGFNTLNEFIQGSLLLKKGPDIFMVPLTLGTPPQSFNVLLDTGSFLLWVSSTTASNEFTLPNRFNPSASETYHSLGQSFEKEYMIGSLTGQYSKDIVSVFKKDFPILWGLGDETHVDMDSDGVLGMGYRYDNEYGLSNRMSLMHQLKKNNFITQNIFSIYREEFNDLNSKLFIGGYHEDFNDKAHVASCKLGDSISWMCPMSQMVVSSSSRGKLRHKVIECNMNAIIDSGSNMIYAPKWMMKPVKKLLPSGCKMNCQDAEYCLIICYDIQAAPDFSMVFGGKSFKLSKRGLYRYHQQNEIYVSNFFFVKNDERPEILIGMPFFYNMHIAFDNENQKILFHSTSIRNVNEDPLFITSNEGDNLSVIALIVIASTLLIGGLLLLVVCLRTKKRDNEYKIDVKSVIQHVSHNVRELILS